MTSYECLTCGVAFNVGSKKCEEKSCPAPTIINEKKRAKYRAKIYDQSKLPLRYKPDPIQSRFAGARYRAGKKGVAFELTQELIQHILNQPCVYCGAAEPIELDRKNNGAGYTPDNIVPACRRCNTIKNAYLTYDQMMIVAEALGWKHGA
jgi:hypothetical protein